MSIRKEMIRRTTTAFVTHKLGKVRVDSQIFCLIILSIYHGSLRSVIFTKSCPSLDFRDGRKELLGCAPGHSEIIAGTCYIEFLSLFQIRSHTILCSSVGNENQHKSQCHREAQGLYGGIKLVA